MQIAVIGDGTGNHEHFVMLVEAENEHDALVKVAEYITDQEDECAKTKAEELIKSYDD